MLLARLSFPPAGVWLAARGRIRRGATGLVALALAAVAVPGCVSGAHIVETVVQPGAPYAIDVVGDEPYVLVGKRGAGALSVEFLRAEGETTERVVPRSAYGVTEALSGPATLVLRATGDSVHARVEVIDADSVSGRTLGTNVGETQIP